MTTEDLTKNVMEVEYHTNDTYCVTILGSLTQKNADLYLVRLIYENMETAFFED